MERRRQFGVGIYIKPKKMKRYQIKRWDKRNTLRALKFTFPLWFMMNVMTVILIYTMTQL